MSGIEKFLKPERFEGHQGTTASQWNHWHRTFTNFLSKCEASDSDKLVLLINHVSPDVYEHISECATYEAAISALKSVYIKPVNKIFARYQLATRKQQGHESLDQFLQSLKVLARECQFTAVSLEGRTEDAIMDAFIAGLSSGVIRQRLLEDGSLTLNAAFQQARSLDLAQQNAEKYHSNMYAASAIPLKTSNDEEMPEDGHHNLAFINSKCSFCGSSGHPRSQCPAREAICFKCSKKGHFSRVCRSSGAQNKTAKSVASTLLASVDRPEGNSTMVTNVKLGGVAVNTLVDSGSFASFIREDVVRTLRLPIYCSKESISMASSNLTTETNGH